MFSFHKNIILRTPSLPFYTQEVDLHELTKADWFQEAIYLASPDLYNSLVDWLSGGEIEKRKLEKLNNSLLKYYSRMISRSTPFGLFAGCAVATWSDKDNIIIKSKDHTRNTRFDMHFTCALAQELIRISSIRQNLKYALNTSLYTVGQELRYIEYQYINGKRSHQISAIQISDYLLKVLEGCQGKKSHEDLAALIINDEVTTEEAIQFIDDLIENQVLVSNLEPSITGGSFLNQINSVLSSLPDTSTIGELNSLEKEITALDLNKINAVNSYKKIASKINDLNFVFDEGKLFQTDLFKYLEQNQLDLKWQGELLDGIKVLNKLSVKKENQNLLKFIERFRNRYEDQEVSLLQALDNESGIGYLEQTLGSVVNPLIDDLILPDNKALPSLQWDEKDNLLYKKLSASIKNGHTPLELDDSDLADFQEPDASDLPPSISVMFKIIADGSKKIHIGSVGGSSATNLLGRFAHGADEINNTIKEICETEQYQNPDVIFAEIIHLPESRTGNILLHPVFREYEIPFLGRASVNSENQIHLQDLFISVRNGKIILRSKRLNKVIIPRLSNAHNYSNNSLPVYHFLCDLQHQGLRSSLSFSWGFLAEKHAFLPRIAYKNIIFDTATWKIESVDFPKIFDSNDRIKRGFPRLMILVEGDNELLIDWENKVNVEVFKNSLIGKKKIVLKEFLYDKENSIVKNEKGEVYVNQFIALLFKNKPTYSSPKLIIKESNNIRSFTLGSEWLYYKIYVGVKLADNFLLNHLKPFIENLFDQKQINYWFFIRYNDPESHLRIRFHVVDVKQIGEILQEFHKVLDSFREANQIWKIQTDTYNRELERYGHENIWLSERLFFINSQYFLDFLNHTKDNDIENIRWLWTLKTIDDLLKSLDFNFNEKLSLMEKLKVSFASEFKMDLTLKKQLDQRYRLERDNIYNFLDIMYLEENFSGLNNISIANNKCLKPITNQILELKNTGELKVDFGSLISSHIHMIVNRFILSSQRLHEMVIYDFLYRYYLSQTKKIK